MAYGSLIDDPGEETYDALLDAPFSELTKDFTPARRTRVAAKAAALRETMTLEELRKARSFSQQEVAEALTVNQPVVAKLEKRGDMHVSNLRRYIKALGGTL
jgi:hypothetical protein